MNWPGRFRGVRMEVSGIRGRRLTLNLELLASPLVRTIVPIAALALFLGGCAGGRSTPSLPENPSPGARAIAPLPVDVATVGSRDARLGCTWVRSTGTIHAGDQDTLEQLRASAVERARGAALRALFGSSVEARFLDFQQEGFRGPQNGQHLVENLVRSTRQGRILSESRISGGYLGIPGCADCLYRVELRSCLAPLASGPDAFAVRVDILPRTTFSPGDTALIRVRMTHGQGKVWIYLYDIEYDGTVIPVAPNIYTDNPLPLEPGRDFTYPDKRLQKTGIRLTAELPPGSDQRISVETIRVIATRTPLPQRFSVLGKKGYWGILARLSKSPIPWSDDAAYFVVEAPHGPGGPRHSPDLQDESSH